MEEKDKLIAELKAENEKLREDYIKLSQQKDLDNARWQKRCTDLHIEDKAKDDKYWFFLDECESAGYKPFDEAIAHFINKLWQDLTPEEKQQVKGILE